MVYKKKKGRYNEKGWKFWKMVEETEEKELEYFTCEDKDLIEWMIRMF